MVMAKSKQKYLRLSISQLREENAMLKPQNTHKSLNVRKVIDCSNLKETE